MTSGRKSVAVSALGNFAAPVVGIVTAPMLAAALGASGRGELAAAVAPLLLAVNMASLGLPDSLVYYSARKGPGYGRFVLTTCIFLGCTGLACSALIYSLSGFLSADDRKLAQLIYCAGFAVSPALILAGLRGAASGFQAWGLVTTEKLINSGTRMCAMAITFYAGHLDLRTATAIMVITTFVGILAYAPLARIAKNYEPREESRPELRFVASFGMRVWLGSMTGILLSRLDQTLMVPLTSTESLGIYVVAVTISEMALIFNSAVAMVVYSRESRRRDSNILAMATRLSTTVTLVGAVAIGLCSIWAIPYFFGEEFEPALSVVWILLLGIVLGNSGSVAGAGLAGRGRPGMRSISLSVALVLNLAVLLLLAPQMGATGAAVATLAGNVTAGYLNLFWLRMIYGLPIRQFLGISRNDWRYVKSLVPAKR